MLPIRSHAGGILAAALLLVTTGGALPAAAADTPEAAIDELFAIVAGGDFSDLDQVVCAADQEAMREAFDVGSQLGLDDSDPTAAALAIEVGDRSVELLSQDGDTATVAVRATMSMSVGEDQLEGLVRSLMEADLGPEDPPLSDEDVEMMVGFMGSALNQSQAIDEEVTVVREEGQWLVCGGLVDEPDEPDYPSLEPAVSTEGMCAIVSPAELSGLSSLQYDSSGGFVEYCSYSTTDFDSYHTTSITLNTDQDVEYVASVYGADEETEVGGGRAFFTGDDDFAPQLFTQVGDDVLQVAVAMDFDPGDVDPFTQARLVTELVAPRVPAFRELLVGPTQETMPEPTPGVSLCAGVSLDELNGLLGLGFDESSGDSSSCQFASNEGEPGFHYAFAYVSEVGLEDYRSWIPDYEDATLAGLPAIVTERQTIVELPGGGRVLDISVSLDAADDGLVVTAAEVAAALAERIVPGIPAPEAPDEPA